MVASSRFSLGFENMISNGMDFLCWIEELLGNLIISLYLYCEVDFNQVWQNSNI